MRVDERQDLALAMKQDNGTSGNAALVRADVLVLLREKRYEEALAVLYRARADQPDNSELQKSIDQIKEFLIGAYAKRLGGLDQVAKPIPVTASRSPDVVLLSRYIDGTSTFGDIAQMSPLGALRTLQIMVGLYPKRESQTGEPKSARQPILLEAAPVSIEAPASAEIIEKSGMTEVQGPYEPAPPESVQRPSYVPPRPVETEEARQYREMFEAGTAAFIQRRYREAVEAFEACDRMRPGDKAAGVMLRRSLHDLAQQQKG